MIDEILANGVVINTQEDSITKLMSYEDESGGKFISFGTNDISISSGGDIFSSIFSSARSLFG